MLIDILSNFAQILLFRALDLVDRGGWLVLSFSEH